MKLKFKTNEEGLIEVNENGLPIAVDEDEDNKKIPIDALNAYISIPKLRGEAKDNRLKYEDLFEQFKKYEKIEDPKKALEALATIEKIDQKELLKAGEVDKVKAQIAETYENRIKDQDEKYQTLIKEHQVASFLKDSQIYDLMVGAKFNKSSYFTGESPKTNLIPEIAQSYFGKHFKVEKNSVGNLEIVAYWNDKDHILSIERPGTQAPFDEAISLIIEKHPQKEHILRSSSGGGAQGGANSKILTNPWNSKTRNLTEQGRILKENPALANQLKVQASTNIAA